MLGGDFSEALRLFTVVYPLALPRELEFMRREALVKSALLEALYGDVRLGRAHLQASKAVPRTQSWVEPSIDATVVLADALVAEPEEMSAKLRRVTELPLGAVGELWPFHLLVLHRLCSYLDYSDTFMARVEVFRGTQPARVAGNGLPGSVFELLAAYDSLVKGDLSRAKKQLTNADPRLVLTQHSSATLALASGHPELALKFALGSRAETKLHRQLEIWRAALETSALLALEDTEAARLTLELLLKEMGGLNVQERRAFSAETHAFANEWVAEWPVPKEDLSLTQVLQAPKLAITKREREILELLVLDKNRQEIAAELHISSNTVKTHTSVLFKKLKVSNRAQLLAEARRRLLF